MSVVIFHLLFERANVPEYYRNCNYSEKETTKSAGMGPERHGGELGGVVWVFLSAAKYAVGVKISRFNACLFLQQ